MTDGEQQGAAIQRPDTINEFAVVGEFGFKRIDGPFSVEKAGTNWTVIIPGERDDPPIQTLDSDEGHAAVLVADCEVVGGGILTDAWRPEGEDELHVIIDQYAMGDPDV